MRRTTRSIIKGRMWKRQERPEKIRAASTFFADGNILELEVVWAVAGLGILKLNPVVVKGLIGDDGKTGIIFQIQVRFVRLGHALHCNGSLTCGDGDPQIIFQIIIDGIAGRFPGSDLLPAPCRNNCDPE